MQRHQHYQPRHLLEVVSGPLGRAEAVAGAGLAGVAGRVADSGESLPTHVRAVPLRSMGPDAGQVRRGPFHQRTHAFAEGGVPDGGVRRHCLCHLWRWWRHHLGDPPLQGRGRRCLRLHGCGHRPQNHHHLALLARRTGAEDHPPRPDCGDTPGPTEPRRPGGPRGYACGRVRSPNRRLAASMPRNVLGEMRTQVSPLDKVASEV
mmetsp:Transcript_44006/g.82237  ORF Transcript_44006/g.82237 Transcript_44006/m.82237 type:complete len:205 (-) Transcript_44006:50-664(-)